MQGRQVMYHPFILQMILPMPQLPSLIWKPLHNDSGGGTSFWGKVDSGRFDNWRRGAGIQRCGGCSEAVNEPLIDKR